MSIIIHMIKNKYFTHLTTAFLALFLVISINLELVSQENQESEPIDQFEGEIGDEAAEVDEFDSNQPADADQNEEIDLDAFIKEIYSQEDFYSPTDKRDPFKPFVKVVDREIEIKPEFNPLLPPIKRFALTQFKLVGVMWLENVPQAMLTDPEKNTYILNIGDEIGNRQGSIVEIRENGIAVEEKYYLENAEGQRSVEIRKSILAFTDKNRN